MSPVFFFYLVLNLVYTTLRPVMFGYAVNTLLIIKQIFKTKTQKKTVQDGEQADYASSLSTLVALSQNTFFYSFIKNENMILKKNTTNLNTTLCQFFQSLLLHFVRFRLKR